MRISVLPMAIFLVFLFPVLHSVEPFCNDSDKGWDAFVPGNVTTEKDIFFDLCTDWRTVREYYCDMHVNMSRLLSCPSGFSCTLNGSMAYCGPDAASDFCRESDAGLEIGVTGIAQNSTGNRTDNCTPSGNLIEYYCNGTQLLSLETIPGQGQECIDGAIVPKALTFLPSGQAVQQVALQPGWSMISFPFSSYSLTPSDPVCVLAVFSFNPSTGAYAKANISRLEAGRGYWVYSDTSCGFKVTGTPYMRQDFSASLSSGWNLIGAPSEYGVAFLPLKGTCTVKSGPWYYDPALKDYRRVTKLEPGKGYWLKVDSACSLGTKQAG